MTRFKEEDPTTLPVVKVFIEAWNDADRPALYATLKRGFAARGKDGMVKVLYTGERVRVTFITGFGDYGVTTALDEQQHHEARATLAEMTDYSDKP